jgi:predicted DNA-binding transcriptional regulator AlpA
MDHGEKDQLLSERDLSDWLGLSEPTLSRHRRTGTGPAFVRLSTRRIAYRCSAVKEWLKQRERNAGEPDASPHTRASSNATAQNEGEK